MADRPWSVKKATVEQYEIRGPHGLWAIITLDPRGIFQAVSDLGTYSYEGWRGHGRESFKHFLVGLREADYFIGKVCGNTGGMRGPGRAGQVFDYDRTVAEIRRRICERRREDLISRSTARDCWDELNELDDPGHDETFWVERVAEKEDLFRHIFGGDYCEVPCCTSLAPLPLRFFTEIFRGRLVPALEAELASRSSPVERVAAGLRARIVAHLDAAGLTKARLIVEGLWPAPSRSEETGEDASDCPSPSSPQTTPCPECKGRGWHPGDCHPREECGSCEGTGRAPQTTPAPEGACAECGNVLPRAVKCVSCGAYNPAPRLSPDGAPQTTPAPEGTTEGAPASVGGGDAGKGEGT